MLRITLPELGGGPLWELPGSSQEAARRTSAPAGGVPAGGRAGGCAGGRAGGRAGGCAAGRAT